MDQEKLLKPIGIERLVDWAFGQQKVALMDGRDRGIFPVLALLSKTTVSYGERIGGGGASGAGYDVHPDAVIVLDAWREVMTYSADGACLVRSYGESGLALIGWRMGNCALSPKLIRKPVCQSRPAITTAILFAKAAGSSGWGNPPMWFGSRGRNTGFGGMRCT